MCTTGCSCIEHLLSRYTGSIPFLYLGKTRHQKHLPEHIQTVIRGRSVGTDSKPDALVQISLYWSDTAGQLGVTSGIGHCIKPTLFKYLKIVVTHPYAVVSTAAVLIHSQLIGKLRGSLAPALDTFLYLQLRLGVVHKAWALVLLCKSRNTLHQLL